MAAAAARACFYARDYAGARGHLQSLGASDSKLRHNLALAEYYAAGAASPALLLAALEGLKRGEGDAEQADEGSLATYNVAVLHFQQQRYGRCRALLEALFANVEPLDEFVAFRVCLLLLEVTLLQGDVPLATQVLGYLDRSYAALTKANGAAKAGGGENGAGGADGGGAPADKPGKAASAPPEWPNKRSSRPSPVAISPTEVKLAMHLARARLLLLLRAPQPAKRELKLALGAHVELLRGNARQALKLVGTLPLPASALSSSSSSASGPSSEPALAAAYYNNLGCVHHGLGKHAREA
ncbi:hypothetical protein T492DRAFT_869020 [Pavlovales sp. CCMP2436]|nr:hypothetical protein T492DRAFT_869020 [Pavlovales sp. CCMP2436]